MGGINNRVGQILGEKQLRGIGRQGCGCRDDLNANAGIERNGELAGLLLVGVGRGGDGDDDVGEFDLIGENRRSSEGGRGGDCGTGIQNAGELGTAVVGFGVVV